MKNAKTVKTAKDSKLTKVASKKVILEKKEILRNISQGDVNDKSRQAKKYAKSFKGVRSYLLSGNVDKAIKLTSYDVIVLEATKASDKASTDLYKWLLSESEYKGTFTRGDGSEGSYSNVFAPHRLLQKIAKIANDVDLQAKFGLLYS